MYRASWKREWYDIYINCGVYGHINCFFTHSLDSWVIKQCRCCQARWVFLPNLRKSTVRKSRGIVAMRRWEAVELSGTICLVEDFAMVRKMKDFDLIEISYPMKIFSQSSSFSHYFHFLLEPLIRLVKTCQLKQWNLWQFTHFAITNNQSQNL